MPVWTGQCGRAGPVRIGFRINSVRGGLRQPVRDDPMEHTDYLVERVDLLGSLIDRERGACDRTVLIATFCCDRFHRMRTKPRNFESLIFLSGEVNAGCRGRIGSIECVMNRRSSCCAGELHKHFFPECTAIRRNHWRGNCWQRSRS